MMNKAATYVMLTALLFSGAVFSSCKKSPLMPDAEELSRPVIWVNTFELSFAAYETGANPSSQTLKIKNSGQNTLEYTVADDADWLSIEPASGTSSGQVNEHAVRIDKEGLAAQENAYTATITVTCAQAYNNPQRATVSLKIDREPPPEISVTPLNLSFSCQVGGANPPAQTFAVWNKGKSVLNYAVSDDAYWLEVNPAAGSSAGEAETRVHTVSANAGGLSQGTYSGIITIACPDATNSPQTVGVTLRVAEIPTNNEISVACIPSAGYSGTTVSVPISILGNLNSISTFGLQLTFDSNMFEYLGTSKGSLTGSWAFVDGNNISGTVTIGGFAGSGSTIPVGSEGSLAVV
ncbi:MAG: hypothetical protein FJY81_01100, partial [Candidatus Aminicenantes bacterium]|nr:hypothetical protein [Candidatus Aminicenantes bacterium]